VILQGFLINTIIIYSGNNLRLIKLTILSETSIA